MSGFTMEELEANHKEYLERHAKYLSAGYDNISERRFIMEAAEGISGRILESGTGKGHFALELAKKGFELTTYDVDPEMQKIAKMNIAWFGLLDSVTFLIEEKEKLSFADSSFDVIFSVNALHHMENSGAVLDELVRVKTKNGKIVLSDFTKDGFELMGKIHASEGREHEVIGWDMDRAGAYLKSKGLKITEKADRYQRVFLITEN